MTLTWGTMRERQAEGRRVSARAAAAIAAAGIAIATFIVYLLTLAPDVYSLDSPELATAAHTLGIAHEPGYPLYTLAGWTFSHAFPIGTVAYRLNVLSAVFASAAAAVTFLVAMRITPRVAVAAAGALALAFSYHFWVNALAAEVYSLDALLYAGLLLAALAWRDRRTAALAAVLGLLLGLALATRTSALLFVPALAAFAWIAGERSPRAYAAAAGGVALGLAFYLYLPLRSLAGVEFGPGTYRLDGTLVVTDLATWSGFWAHVSAAQFRPDAFAYGPLGALREGGVFGSQLARGFLVIGLPLGIAGIARLWQRDRGMLILIGGTALPVALFFINYGTVDKEFMFLPAYVAWALLAVAGIDWAIDVAVASDASLAGKAWVASLALTLPLLLLATNWPQVTLHDERGVRADAESFLAVVEADAIVYGPFMEVAPLQYLQEVEGQRPDVRLVNDWRVNDAFLIELARANVGMTPFYVMREESALRGLYRLAPAGEGFQVLPREAAP
jgi:hypothetical protein